VPALNALLTDAPMNRQPWMSRRRNIRRSNNALRYDTAAVLIVLHCFLLQFGLTANRGIAARAADPGVAPLVQVRYTASQRFNHERMNALPQFRLSEDDSEARWSRRSLQAVAACSAYPVCAAAGLVNDCCPTSDGVILGCCDVTSSPGMWFVLAMTLHLLDCSVY
jgi:hypothetical protein